MKSAVTILITVVAIGQLSVGVMGGKKAVLVYGTVTTKASTTDEFKQILRFVKTDFANQITQLKIEISDITNIEKYVLKLLQVTCLAKWHEVYKVGLTTNELSKLAYAIFVASYQQLFDMFSRRCGVYAKDTDTDIYLEELFKTVPFKFFNFLSAELSDDRRKLIEGDVKALNKNKLPKPTDPLFRTLYQAAEMMYLARMYMEMVSTLRSTALPKGVETPVKKSVQKPDQKP